MIKRFRPFDPKVIEKEFSALHRTDRGKLMTVMLAFEANEVGPILVQTYGDGVLCVRHSNGRYQGRCLFAEMEDSFVMLTVYKKEKQEVPSRILDRARARMRTVEEERE